MRTRRGLRAAMDAAFRPEGLRGGGGLQKERKMKGKKETGLHVEGQKRMMGKPEFEVTGEDRTEQHRQSLDLSLCGGRERRVKRLEGNAGNTKCGGKKYRRIEIPEIPVYGARGMREKIKTTGKHTFE